MQQLIQFPDKHAAAYGTTQTGKTYGVQKSLLKVPEGVLFFNTNHTDHLRGYTKANKNIELETLLDAIRSGDKINYLPSRESRWAEVAAISEAILETGKLNCRIVYDETHLMYLNPDKMKRRSQAAVEEVVTTGLSKGMKAIFITQRPALLDNTLMTQSEFKVFYRTEDETPYLKKYGVPAEEIMKRLNEAGEYAYCTYYRGEVDGAFKV